MSEDRSELPSQIPSLSNKDRQEVREFSKKNYPSDRQNTRAAVFEEVKGIRQERDRVYSSERHQGAQKNALQDKQRELLASQESLAQRLQDAENALRSREASLMSRIVDSISRGKTKRPFQEAVTSLSEQLKTNQGEGDAIPPQLVALDEEMRRTLLQKLALRSDREVLERFYKAWGRQLDAKKQRDALAEYIPQHGRLEKVVGQYNCYVMHAITPELQVNANNSVLNSHVPWEDRLALLVDIQPAISTSAFIHGNRNNSSWSGIGVFCSGEGYIESAAGGDRGTKARGVKERSGAISTIDEYTRKLSEAILTPHCNGININELVLSGDYSIAGLYINLDDRRLSKNAFYTGKDDIMVTREGKRQMTNNIMFADIFAIGEQFGMPMYAYQAGKAYEATIDTKTGGVCLGEEVPPKEMVQRKYVVPEDKRRDFRDRSRRSLRWPGTVAALV